MFIRAEKKLSRLLITAAILAPLALPVQAEFIERKIEAPNLTPTTLLTTSFSLITEEAIVADLRGPSSVKDITLTVNGNGELVIRNNTVRMFSDLNAIIDGTGVTIKQAIQPRTTVTVALTDISLSAETTLTRLEPYGVYSPNANGFNESVEKDIWVDVYADIQRNMMKFYARAETYDYYQNYFWSERDESKSSTLSKWHKTATYDIPKNYRKAHKAAGLASSSWLALAAYTLDRSFTVTDYIYTSHYGTFSHEYGHTMGFNHDSGMAYGWDNPVRAEMQKLIANGTVNRVASGDEPTNHDMDFFLHFDEAEGLTLYQQADAEFNGIDWINVVYDDAKISLGETRIDGSKITFDIAKTAHDKILFNARLTDQEFMANLSYQTQDTGAIELGSSTFFIPDMSENISSGIITDVATDVVGPTAPVLNVGSKTSFRFPVTAENGETLVVQAWGDKHYPGCEWKPMEDAAGCSTRHQQSFDANLRISVTLEDNPQLIEGTYTGSLPLTQIDYFDQASTKPLILPINISVFSDPTPAKFAAEQAQHEQARAALVDALPLFDGAITGNTNSSEAFSVDINGDTKTLCYFHAVKKDLSTKSLLGFVENNTCTIGELNSYNGIAGFSSESFLTFNRDTISQIDDKVMITLPETGEELQICYRNEDPFTGVGFIRGRKCVSNMTASNGKGWGFSSGNQYLTQSRDTLDQLPENEGWVLPSANITPLTVSFDHGENAICRMSILGTQLLGYVDDAKCTIGANNIWKGAQGFASSQYQVVDINAKRKISAVKITVQESAWFTEPLDLEVCYRPEADVAGVGFSTYGGQCMQHDRGVMKATGKGWYFGYDSNSPKVMWEYSLRTDDIWLTPSTSQLAFKLPTSAGEKTVCRFEANDKAHYGLVNELNQCELGANNRLNGEYNFHSDEYQVIRADANLPGENISFFHDNDELVQLCSHNDTVGYSFNGQRCEQAEMLGDNGSRWLHNSDNAMQQYIYQFPEDNAWVFPTAALTPYVASTQQGELAVCRTHFDNRTVMGFVVDNQCKINSDLSIEDTFGFSNARYQVIDTSLGNSGDAVMVTWEDGVSREICYRPTSKWMGVGYRGNRGNRYVNRCQSNLGADNGGGFFFSKGNTLITFP